MAQQSAIIFDLDGTLTKPVLNFDAIRAEIGVSGPILEAMSEMTPQAKRRAEEILDRYENHAAQSAELYDGAVEVIAMIRSMGRPVAILTRNSRSAVDTVLSKYDITVDAVRSREDGAIKPSPEPIFSICRELDADPSCSWMVGDYLFDILSGRSAGATTVLMMGVASRPPFADEADHVIRALGELLPLVESA